MCIVIICDIMFQNKQFDEVRVINKCDEGIEFKRGLRWVEDQTLPESTKWVTFPDGTQCEFIGKYLSRQRSESDAFIQLWRDLDGFPIQPGTEWIPLDVALSGTTAITVYLRVVGQLSREEIADRMGVQEPTIRKYISKYRREDK